MHSVNLPHQVHYQLLLLLLAEAEAEAEAGAVLFILKVQQLAVRLPLLPAPQVRLLLLQHQQRQAIPQHQLLQLLPRQLQAQPVPRPPAQPVQRAALQHHLLRLPPHSFSHQES